MYVTYYLKSNLKDNYSSFPVLNYDKHLDEH